MHTLLISAGLIAIVVGLIHSVMGEVLIFSRLRKGEIVPTRGHPVLRERYVRIIWASWHLVTIFGLTIAAILFALASSLSGDELSRFIINVIVVCMFSSSALVMFATKGMHPGWLGLLAISFLCWVA